MDTIGKIIRQGEQKDAIHIAIAPVIATTKMRAGQHIGFVIDGDTEHVGFENPCGIVDPFLTMAIMPEQRFWMFMYPNTITSLRHDWTHPAFTATKKEAGPSEVWLRAFGAQHGMSYEAVLEAGTRYAEYGEYLCEGGRFEGDWVPDEFWPHYENVTGKTVDESKRGSFFSCSC